MFNSITNIKKKREKRRLLLEFLAEIGKNWESWHVMDQRNVLDLFYLDVWSKIKADPPISLDEAITGYAEKFENYNKLMKEFKDFEKWYAASTDNKTPENAKKLHGMKQIISEKFRENMLEAAQKARDRLAQELTALKILK